MLTALNAGFDYHVAIVSRAIRGWLVGADSHSRVNLKMVKQRDTAPATAAAAYFTGENLHRLETPSVG